MTCYVYQFPLNSRASVDLIPVGCNTDQNMLQAAAVPVLTQFVLIALLITLQIATCSHP